MTSTERARDLKQKPAVVRASAQGMCDDQQMMTSYYRESIVGLPEMGLVARQLYDTAELTPADIQTGVIYDHFTPFVLVQLYLCRAQQPAPQGTPLRKRPQDKRTL